MNGRLLCLAALVATGATNSPSRAWGPIGHRVVAETAALLVEDDQPQGWGPMLARHRFALGVYAFVPDARFRLLDGKGGKLEAPTHYLYLDAPKGTAPGSVDRRAAQFLERAQKQLGPVRAPAGGYLAGSKATGEVRRIFRGLVELGVLAHYSGDAAVPFHATADTQGEARGQGGIHFYFESDCVDAFEPGLAADVLTTARSHGAAWRTAWHAADAAAEDLVRAVLKDSLTTVESVLEIDRSDAVTKLQAPGSAAFAVRKPPAAGCQAMRPILVERLAKGALLTAILWERALPRGVDFSKAAGLNFSDLDPVSEYVPPSGVRPR